MRAVTFTPDSDGWLFAAESLLAARVPPHEILWVEEAAHQPLLPDLLPAAAAGPSADAGRPRLPSTFTALVPEVSRHRADDKWRVLYTVLYRLTFEQPHLLAIDVDPDVRQLHRLRQQIRKDVYRMKALVRFRRVRLEGDERYVAWHEPDHDVLELAAPFFVERFASMPWSLLTPRNSMHWDGVTLRGGPGVPLRQAPLDDALEELWRTYYATTFNPARLNDRAMRTQLPVRFWRSLPESRVIAPLETRASGRVTELFATGRAQPEVPNTTSWPVLAEAARACTGCTLHQAATQTVFGQGPLQARLMLVGEQPGDQEDRSGAPFVGPAGGILDRALAAAGLPREQLYVTNAVKHFKFVLHRGTRRHQRPNATEVVTCRPWLEAELRLVQPSLVVALGSTAAHALLGRTISVLQHHGERIHSPSGQPVLLTLHPSAILRARDDASRQALFEILVADLRRARVATERSGIEPGREVEAASPPERSPDPSS